MSLKKDNVKEVVTVRKSAPDFQLTPFQQDLLCNYSPSQCKPLGDISRPLVGPDVRDYIEGAGNFLENVSSVGDLGKISSPFDLTPYKQIMERGSSIASRLSIGATAASSETVPEATAKVGISGAFSGVEKVISVHPYGALAVAGFELSGLSSSLQADLLSGIKKANAWSETRLEIDRSVRQAETGLAIAATKEIEETGLKEKAGEVAPFFARQQIDGVLDRAAEIRGYSSEKVPLSPKTIEAQKALAEAINVHMQGKDGGPNEAYHQGSLAYYPLTEEGYQQYITNNQERLDSGEIPPFVLEVERRNWQTASEQSSKKISDLRQQVEEYQQADIRDFTKEVLEKELELGGNVSPDSSALVRHINEAEELAARYAERSESLAGQLGDIREEIDSYRFELRERGEKLRELRADLQAGKVPDPGKDPLLDELYISGFEAEVQKRQGIEGKIKSLRDEEEILNKNIEEAKHISEQAGKDAGKWSAILSSQEGSSHKDSSSAITADIEQIAVQEVLENRLTTNLGCLSDNQEKIEELKQQNIEISSQISELSSQGEEAYSNQSLSYGGVANDIQSRISGLFLQKVRIENEIKALEQDCESITASNAALQEKIDKMADSPSQDGGGFFLGDNTASGIDPVTGKDLSEPQTLSAATKESSVAVYGEESSANPSAEESSSVFDLSRLWSNVRVNNSGDNTGGWQIGLNGSSEKGSAGTGLADIGSPAGKESAEVSASSGLTTESTAATQNNAAMDSSESSGNTSSGGSSIFDISGLWSNMHLNGSDNNGYSGIDWNIGDSGDNENPLLSSLKEGLSLTPEESAGSGSLLSGTDLLVATDTPSLIERGDGGQFLSGTSAGQPAAEIPASSSRELEHNLAAANSIKEYYNSIYNLSKAFEHGTVFDKGGSVLEHLSAGVEAGRYFNEGSGGSSSASDSFSSTAGANLDAAASAFGLAGAIDSGDGLAIAHSGLKLVSSIDRALDLEARFDDSLQTTSDTAGLSDDAAQGLGIAMSGLDLAMALEDGDGLAIAASGVSLAKNISGAAAGSGLGVLGSGLSFAQDIDGLDDAFASGDARTIAQATMNTAYDGISLYNSASAMAGFSQVGASNLPVIGAAIGVAQGVMRAFDGDVARGAVDAGVAVASYYLMMAGPYGWVAAAVLNIANALFNTSEPPKGHADFSIENGVVDFAVSGDSEMEGQTSGMAEVIRGSMQSYINGGGRVAIEGEKMLTLSTESGATPHLDYGSIGGGNIRVNLDSDDLGGSLLGVLVARDRGADLSMAIRQSQLPGGGIDIAHVDAVMAGLGYVKDGINYVYGERTEVNLSAVGTGVFAGGHNVGGPEGEVIVARQSDVTVHPPWENQLPQRTMGKVIENIDVGSNLLGAGSSLFAAALMGVGLGRNQANAAEFTPSIANREGSLPLDAATAAAYRRGDWLPADAAAEKTDAAAPAAAISIAGDCSPAELAAFIKGEWGNIRFSGTPADSLPVSAAVTDGAVMDTDTASSQAAMAAGVSTISMQDIFRASAKEGGLEADIAVSAAAQGSASTNVSSANEPSADEPSADESSVNEFSADISSANESPADAASVNTALSGQGSMEGEAPSVELPPEPPPEIVRGAVFHTVEAGSLRFIADQLVAPVGTVTLSSEVGQFAGFGTVEHGSLSVDKNGDCRFTPDKDYTGYASFRYFLEYDNGERQELEAGVHVAAENHAPQVKDDTLSLQQGEIFFVDQLLANDSDIDGDNLHLLRFSTPAHGSFTTIDGRAALVADKDFYGSQDLVYWVGENRPGGDSEPVAGHAVLNYVYKSATDDKFITDEDKELTVDIDKLLANDMDQRGERVTFAGLGKAEHGTVRLDGESIIFTPDADYTGDKAGFSYSVTASDKVVTSGFVTVAVNGVNDAPTAVKDSLEIEEGQPVIFDQATLGKLFADIDGDTLQVREVSASAGTISEKDGIYTLTLKEDFQGETELELVVADGAADDFIMNLQKAA